MVDRARRRLNDPEQLQQRRADCRHGCLLDAGQCFLEGESRKRLRVRLDRSRAALGRLADDDGSDRGDDVEALLGAGLAGHFGRVDGSDRRSADRVARLGSENDAGGEARGGRMRDVVAGGQPRCDLGGGEQMKPEYGEVPSGRRVTRVFSRRRRLARIKQPWCGCSDG